MTDPRIVRLLERAKERSKVLWFGTAEYTCCGWIKMHEQDARAAVRPTCESQNTQSPRLRFCALLTEGGDPRVQLHRA
jgi:hypothetical protein